MTTPEAESFAELIADCADIPTVLQGAAVELALPRVPDGWAVDDAAFAQVNTMEEYV